MTCIPSEDIDRTKLEAAQQQLLQQLGVEHAGYWAPSKGDPARHEATRLQLNVLMRWSFPPRLGRG